MDKEFEYQESSNVGSFYLKHVDAMKLTDGQPVDKSFAVDKNEYSIVLLREIANLKSVNKKAFVVIEWPDVFEIRRLPDGASPKSFYNHCGKTKIEEVETVEEVKAKDGKEVLKNILFEYNQKKLENCTKYDGNLTPEIKSENTISLAYIQRRCGCLAMFRKSKLGSTEQIKKNLSELENEGILETIPLEIAKGLFDTTAKLYRILKTGD